MLVHKVPRVLQDLQEIQVLQDPQDHKVRQDPKVIQEILVLKVR